MPPPPPQAAAIVGGQPTIPSPLIPLLKQHKDGVGPSPGLLGDRKPLDFPFGKLIFFSFIFISGGSL